MRTVAIAAMLVLVAPQAWAQTRYDVAGMTCQEVQALLKADGSAILRYRSAYNFSLPLYDLYVSGQRQCPAGEVAVRKGVPTSDRGYCPVYRCIESDIFVAR